MPTVKRTLHPRGVEQLQPVNGERTDFVDVDKDGRPSGLILRVAPSGARSYSVRYSLQNRDVRFSIGDASKVALGAAREEAERVLGLVRNKRDPHAEREAELREAEAMRRASASAVTVGELGQRFLAYRTKDARTPLRENTRRQWQGILDRHVRPALGDRAAADVRRSDARVLIERIAEKHPVMANRVLEFLRVTFNWATEAEILDASPLVGLKKRGTERTRSRVLTHDEIRRVWAALDPDLLRAELKDGEDVILPALSDNAARSAAVVGDAFRLALFTGARVSEIIGAPWAEMDLDARLWTVAPERSKNGSAHPIPLSTPALALLKNRTSASPWVFPSPRKPGQHLRKTQDTVLRVRLRAGLDDFEGFHDIRRTVRTSLADLNVPAEVGEAVLGHIPPKIVRTYNLSLYVPQMRVALEAWARKLDAIVSGEETAGEVVAFNPRSA